MNDRIFINNSAIGLYPLMVLDRDLQRKRLGRSKRLAMVVASLRTLARFNHQRLTLTVNDEKERVDTPLLFVGNNDYRIDLGAPGQRESIEDGTLSVFVMRKKTRRGLIAASIRALFNRARDDDMVKIENVQRLRVSSHRSALAASLDGEVVGAAPPLDYKIRSKALRVIAPDVWNLKAGRGVRSAEETGVRLATQVHRRWSDRTRVRGAARRRNRNHRCSVRAPRCFPPARPSRPT